MSAVSRRPPAPASRLKSTAEFVSVLRRLTSADEGEVLWFETIGSLQASVVRLQQNAFMPLPLTSSSTTAWKPLTSTPWPHDCTVRGRPFTAMREVKLGYATPFYSALLLESSTQFAVPSTVSAGRSGE